MIKIKFIILCFVSALSAFALTCVPIIKSDSFVSIREKPIREPIILDADSIYPGMSKEEIRATLGEPSEEYSSEGVYIYYRRVINLRRDQVIVVQFRNDTAQAVDTNVNLR